MACERALEVNPNFVNGPAVLRMLLEAVRQRRSGAPAAARPDGTRRCRPTARLAGGPAGPATPAA